MSDEGLGGWPELSGGDPDGKRWDEIKRIFKQIRPEDRRWVRAWIVEGYGLGREAEYREYLARYCSEGTVRLTELLESLIIRHYKDIDSAFDVLIGMDLESERLSELNEQQ